MVLATGRENKHGDKVEKGCPEYGKFWRENTRQNNGGAMELAAS
jgi:hypothetical protein